MANSLNADNFINIPFEIGNLDRYVVRTSILRSLRDSLPFLKGRMLDIGCGGMPYRKFVLEHANVTKYIGLDIDTSLDYSKDIKPDFRWDGITMPFSNEEFDSAFCTEVLEHCPDPGVVLAEIFRTLKPGGTFFFTVPFLWPLHEVPHDEFRYTPFALERLLRKAGFQGIDLSALGGWNASLAQMMGLWIRRSRMHPTKRKVISHVIAPIIKNLIRTDKRPVKFGESTMITGLSGIALK